MPKLPLILFFRYRYRKKTLKLHIASAVVPVVSSKVKHYTHFPELKCVWFIQLAALCRTFCLIRALMNAAKKCFGNKKQMFLTGFTYISKPYFGVVCCK